MEKFDYVNSGIKEKAKLIDVGLDNLKRLKTLNERVTAFVDLLILAGIKIIAFDFDLTMITKHSGGFVIDDESSSNILNSLSKELNLVATEAQKRNMEIACATFSEGNKVVPGFLAGEALVKRVLKRCNATFTIDGFYCFNPANYQTKEKYSMLGLVKPMPLNKHYHLWQIAKDFGVSPSEIILIDDDPGNCVKALMHGFLALNVSGKKGFSIRKLSIPSCSKNLCTIT